MDRAKNAIKCPTCLDDVTPEWLLSVMTKALDKSTIKVANLRPFVEGTGVLSSVFKADIIDKGEKGEEVVLKLFIKTALQFGLGSQYDSFIRNTSPDIAEVKAYKEDFAKMIQFEEEHIGSSEVAKIIPKVYACDYNETEDDTERGFYLIMEDITVDGFVPVMRRTGLTLDQFRVVLPSIARIHAVSYAYGLKNQVVHDRVQRRMPYHGFLEDPDSVTMTANFIKKAMVDFANHKTGQHVVPFLDKLSKDFVTPMKKVFDIGEDNRFLSHGDFGANNVFMNKDDNSCKIFDWQFISAQAPFVDFIECIVQSADPANVEAWWSQLLDIYMETIRSTCDQFDVAMPFTKNEFEKECKTRGYFFVFCAVLFGYDPICRDPVIFERFVWYTGKAVEHSPHFFNAN